MFCSAKRFPSLREVVALCATALTAPGATKTLVSVANPITPAADTTKALAVSGYCSPVAVKNLTTGSTFTSIPPFTGCAEVPLVISPGLPGFPAGSAYVAYPNDATNTTIIGAIPPGGSPTPSLLASISGKFDHVGLVFDSSGLYGAGLLIVTETGQVYSLSTGLAPSAPKSLGTISGIPSPHIESPVIAPQGFGPAGGQLWVVNEHEHLDGDNKIYAVSPALTAHAVLDTDAVLGTADRTESIVFPACSVPVPGHPGLSSNLQDALFALNAVAFYNAPSNAGYVNREFGGGLYQFVPSGNSYALLTPAFDSGLGQQEHLSTSVCLASSVCTLTQGGYKNRFSYLVTNLPTGGLFLGGTFYTNSELLQILQNNAVNGNGLISLAHQLITAMLNQFYGAVPTAAQAQAIKDANALIATIQSAGTKVIPPSGSGSLSPSVSSGLETILDQFNNGKECK
jgi:hypothetical protein